MFERITAQLEQSSMTERELARRLGMAYETLLGKLAGRESFTLDEAIRLRMALGSPDSIETLFSDREADKKGDI